MIETGYNILVKRLGISEYMLYDEQRGECSLIRSYKGLTTYLDSKGLGDLPYIHVVGIRREPFNNSLADIIAPDFSVNYGTLQQFTEYTRMISWKKENRSI